MNKRQTISIAWGEINTTTIQLQAHVTGALAVHRQAACKGCLFMHDPATCQEGWRETNQWVVTHIPTGRRIGDAVPSYRQAVRYKRLLLPLADWATLRHNKGKGCKNRELRR